MFYAYVAAGRMTQTTRRVMQNIGTKCLQIYNPTVSINTPGKAKSRMMHRKALA